jgi:hypothetical protein
MHLHRTHELEYVYFHIKNKQRSRSTLMRAVEPIQAATQAQVFNNHTNKQTCSFSRLQIIHTRLRAYRGTKIIQTRLHAYRRTQTMYTRLQMNTNRTYTHLHAYRLTETTHSLARTHTQENANKHELLDTRSQKHIALLKQTNKHTYSVTNPKSTHIQSQIQTQKTKRWHIVKHAQTHA